MKTKLGIIAIATGLLFSAGASFAGEGGVAAAISVHIDTATSKVDFAAAAMAVGKTTAYAFAEALGNATGNIANASAVGTGGALVMDRETGRVTSVTEESTTGLVISQANTLTETINLNLGPDSEAIDYS